MNYPKGSLINLAEYRNEELQQVLNLADTLKRDNKTSQLAAGKVLGLMFFNSSLRTRVSFEAAAAQLGASSTIIQPGSGTWPLEIGDGVVMDGDKSEHVKEAMAVLSRYCDVIGVRAFAGMEDYDHDISDYMIKMLAEYTDVPFLNLESAASHPFQGLADWLTLNELFGSSIKSKKLVLRWAPHPKSLPMAVPNTALQVAARAGMNVVLNCPEEFVPDEQIISDARQFAKQHNNQVSISYENDSGLADADVVYVKSWGAPLLYSSPKSEHKLRTTTYRKWTVKEKTLAPSNNAKVMHCLPVRRNVVIADEVLDHPQAVHINQAENRLHAQKAWLHQLWD